MFKIIIAFCFLTILSFSSCAIMMPITSSTNAPTTQKSRESYLPSSENQFDCISKRESYSEILFLGRCLINVRMKKVTTLKIILLGYCISLAVNSLNAQLTRNSSWCNPINIDYTYMIFNSAEGISYRSGTSIRANVREAQNAESKADFIHKLGIAQKECDETIYWRELLNQSGYLNNQEFD